MSFPRVGELHAHGQGVEFLKGRKCRVGEFGMLAFGKFDRLLTMFGVRISSFVPRYRWDEERVFGPSIVVFEFYNAIGEPRSSKFSFFGSLIHKTRSCLPPATGPQKGGFHTAWGGSTKKMVRRPFSG